MGPNQPETQQKIGKGHDEEMKERRQDDEDFGGKRGKQKANKKGKTGQLNIME